MTSDVNLAVLGGGCFGIGPFAIDGSAVFVIVGGGGPAVITSGAFAAAGPVPPM